MNKTSALLLAGFLGSVSVLTGCTPETHSLDADSAVGSFKNPTGSFTKDSGAAAFSGYSSQHQQTSSVGQPSTGGSGTSSTQSASHTKLLAKTLDAKSACTEGEKCACAGGGSATYNQEASDIGKAIKFEFTKCVSDDGSAFDGEALLLVATKPIVDLGDAGEAAGATDDQNVLFAAKGTATEDDKSLTIEFALLSQQGWALLAVEVPDGKIVVGVAPSGDAFVKAKQGTWACKPDAKKHYSCTSIDGEGDAIDVDSDPTATATASSADAPADDKSSL